MPPLTSLPARPGIFINENTSLGVSSALSLYSRVYYLGSSTIGDALTGIPTSIGSMDDFSNVFGSSIAINLNNLATYFNNTTRGLYFVKVKPAPVATVTIASVGSGTYDLIVNGVDISTIIPATPTPTAQTIITAVINSINNNTSINQYVEAEVFTDNSGNADYTNSAFRLRSKNIQPFTLVKNGTNITISTVAAPGTLNYWDYLSAIDGLFQTESQSPLGFVVCPEAFYNLVNQFDRTVVANRLENLAKRINWFALLDPASPTVVNNTISAKQDALNAVSVSGSSAYYFPYGSDLTGNDVSPSVLVAAHALLSYEVYGIDKPPAGATNFAFNGISKLQYTLSDPQRDDLAQAQINPLIYKAGVGYVPYDTLTRSTDPRFKMISARIILNCIERSIHETLNVSGILFQSNRSKGLLYIKLRAMIENILGVFYDAGALYGATPELAYAVQCDETIQNAANLESGVVTALIYMVPAGTVRQINGMVYPITIGGLKDAITFGG